MITRAYSLDDINNAYADMHAGLNIRGALTFGERREVPRAPAARDALPSR